MEKITQDDLLKNLAKEMNTTKADAKFKLKAVVDVIVGAAWDGKSVSIHGLGTFTPKDRAAKTGRNPATGEAIKIPAKRVLAFKPSSKVDLG